MTRFGIYESVKQNLEGPGSAMPFYQKVLLGGFAGCVGGLVGTPADLINVRLVLRYIALYTLSSVIVRNCIAIISPIACL